MEEVAPSSSKMVEVGSGLNRGIMQKSDESEGGESGNEHESKSSTSNSCAVAPVDPTENVGVKQKRPPTPFHHHRKISQGGSNDAADAFVSSNQYVSIFICFVFLLYMSYM
jgi:hypothetical protein